MDVAVVVDGVNDAVSMLLTDAVVIGGAALDARDAVDVNDNDADDAGFFLHDGYPAIAQLVASSSAFLVAAADDTLDGPGVDADLGGARTTTDAGLPRSSSTSILSLSSSSSSVFCLSYISLLLIFLCDFVLNSIFPVAFLSAVFLFFLLSSSPVTFVTPSRPAAPCQLSPKCGFFPLLLAPN